MSLPVEVCERIIDMLAGDYSRTPMDPTTRSNLNTCRLVCRAWVPRCRLHLFDEIFVNSRDALRSLAAFLRASSFHTDRVRILRIYGGGTNQSWISTIPFSLPKLPRLSRLDLIAVDFAQQPPQFYQVFSLLRARSQDFRICFDQNDLRAMPARAATFTTALHLPLVKINPNSSYPVQTAVDVALLKSWPVRLTSCISLETRGTLQALVVVLPAWSRPIMRWKITIQSSLTASLGELSRESRRVWKSVARIFAKSTLARPGLGNVYVGCRVEGWGKLELDSVDRVDSTFTLRDCCYRSSLFRR